MKMILKHFIKPIRTCFTLISCLCLGALAFVLINPSAITKLAQDSIQKIVHQHTDDSVTLGALHWGIFPLSIKAHNVCIQHAGSNNPLIFSLESVQLKPNIWRFLVGDYSAAVHIQINNALSLQADSNWSSENNELILNNAIFQYRLSNKDPILIPGHFKINTHERTLTGTLQGSNMQKAILNIKLGDTSADSKPIAHLTLSVQEGNIPGIDLRSLLKHVQASVQSFIKLPFKQQLLESQLIIDSELREWKAQANTHQLLSTPFTSLEATATLDKGILTNQDLKLTQKNLSISAQGTLNLVDGSLDFHALAHLNTEQPIDLIQDKHAQETQGFITNTPLGITLSGNLQSPAISPELTAYFQTAVKQLCSQSFEKNTMIAEPIKTYENLFDTQH